MQFKSDPNTLKRQNREVALLCALLVAYWCYTKVIGQEISAIIIGALILTALFKPDLFNPLRVLWFKLAHVLGSLSSRVVLSLAYFLILIPVSLIKRKSFRKRFHLDSFKKSHESVLIVNENYFCEDDILNPY